MNDGAAVRSIEQDLGELLLETPPAEAAEMEQYREYGGEPLRFIDEGLGVDLWSAQREVVRSVVEHRETVVQGANGVGKDFAASCLGLYWIYATGGLVLATGPTEHQVQEAITRGPLKRLFWEAELPGQLYTRALRVPGSEGELLAKTAEDVSRLTGYHRGQVLVLITEAQGVGGHVYEAADANAVGGEDRVLAYGNPLEASGRYYRAARSDGTNTIRIDARDHPNIRSGEPRLPGGPSREWIRMMRDKHGQDSPQWKARVLGVFPDQSEFAVFDADRVEAAMERREEPRETNGLAVLGVDPAGAGADRSAIAVCQDGRVSKLEVHPETSTKELAERVHERLEELRGEPRAVVYERWRRKHGHHVPKPPLEGVAVVDEAGLGLGVADDLDERDNRVEGFKGARQADDNERFVNLRAEAHFRLRRLLEKEEVSPGVSH